MSDVAPECEVGEAGDCPIIVDVGSAFVKAGLQIHDQPSVVFPSLVGRPRSRYQASFEGSPAFVGEEAIAQRHKLSFVYPVDHGHVDEWLDMEELWSHTFSCLNVNTNEHPVLVTEPPLCSREHREKVAESMFEVYDVPELNMALQAIMALYATGRSTGLVVEIGEGVTQVVPVYEGYSEMAALRRSDFGGQELTLYLQRVLCAAGYPMTSRDDYEYVRMIKESLCYVALDPETEEEERDVRVTFSLPDGVSLRDGVTRSIDIGKERFYCPELLFEPRLVKRDNPPIPELIWQSIQNSALESRKAMMGAILLSGGSSLFPGMQERLEQELKFSAPPQARSSVRVISSGSLFSVWKGAQLFCQPSMRAMQDHLWITKADWHEVGTPIVHQKVALKSSAGR